VSLDPTSDQRRRFDLHELVRDTVATYAAQLRCANCRIELDVAPKPLLDSYPGGLEQALSLVQQCAGGCTRSASTPDSGTSVTIKLPKDVACRH